MVGPAPSSRRDTSPLPRHVPPGLAGVAESTRCTSAVCGHMPFVPSPGPVLTQSLRLHSWCRHRIAMCRGWETRPGILRWLHHNDQHRGLLSVSPGLDRSVWVSPSGGRSQMSGVRTELSGPAARSARVGRGSGDGVARLLSWRRHLSGPPCPQDASYQALLPWPQLQGICFRLGCCCQPSPQISGWRFAL